MSHSSACLRWGRAAALLVLTVGTPAVAQDELSVAENAYALTLGDTTVHAVVHSAGPDGLDLFVLHDDENTAVEAGLEFLRNQGGRLVEVRAQGERRVAFSFDGREFSVDPNRVFTAAGARRTLDPEAGEGAVAVARLLGDALVGIYGADSTIITLHNNTPGQYSARSYLPGGRYASDAAQVHLVPHADPDDFFFVTDATLYSALAAGDFNVVLQDSSATDDGSLSVWAAQQGRAYVNVEAEHGHRAEQVRMLRYLAETLARYRR